jgi:hypothetical protein
MPNLLRTKWQQVKAELTEEMNDLKGVSGDRTLGFRATRCADKVKRAIDALGTGLGDSLDKCQTLFKAQNKGTELQAEARKALDKAQTASTKIHGLETDNEFAPFGFDGIKNARARLNEVIHALTEYANKGMGEQTNFFGN